MSSRANQTSNPLLRKWRRFSAVWRMDAHLRRLVVEAAWRLLGLKALFTVLPFRKQRRYFGRVVKPALGEAHNNAIPLTPEQEKLARQVGWAVWKVEKHLPIEIVCLPMALVSRRMLSKRGVDSVMIFGAEQDKPVADVGTHAWLDCGPVQVSGYPLALTHSPFAAFINAPD